MVYYFPSTESNLLQGKYEFEFAKQPKDEWRNLSHLGQIIV